MAAVPANLPQATQPVVGSSGLVTPSWLAYFQALFNRTGGAGGGGTAVVIDTTSSVTLTGPNALVNARSDADAATKSVAVGEIYRNGSVLQVRVT